MATQISSQGSKYPRWFYAILIFIPVIFFVLLEAGLRIANYGQQWVVFSELSSQYPGVLGLNPDLMHKYFPNLKNTPTPIFDGFEQDKTPGTIRIFVLGESSAAGWPYIPNASFPRVLKQKLQLVYPDKKFEVINMGISAICTYTIRDLLPEVLKQQPDAILIYTGHNEYYGALGAASTQSFGQNRWLVNLLLSLQDFKTVQLVQNFIKYIAGVASSQPEKNDGNETLMAKVIGESAIALNSDIYQQGLNQFEGNMTDILQLCKKAGVPVILGTVASNIKDLKPFISTNDSNNALAFYNKAKEALAAGRTNEAKELFIKAKDADGLRFRAPSEINTIIKNLGVQFQYPVVDIDSVLSANSPDGIIGANLMVDHLHPNVKGYRLLGLAYFSALQKANFIAQSSATVSNTVADSIVVAQFPFTQLDSVIADLRIRILTGTYPFVPKGSPNLLTQQFSPATFVDTLAVLVVDRGLSLEEAHYRLADRKYQQNDIAGFERELKVLIADRPINRVHYEKLITGLLEKQNYPTALEYLFKLESIEQSEFTYKWIGSIYVNNGNYTKGREYLEKFVARNSSDPMVWYNLSGAYANTNAPELALKAVKNAIRLQPGYPDAIAFYRQLAAAYGMK